MKIRGKRPVVPAPAQNALFTSTDLRHLAVFLALPLILFGAWKVLGRPQPVPVPVSNAVPSFLEEDPRDHAPPEIVAMYERVLARTIPRPPTTSIPVPPGPGLDRIHEAQRVIAAFSGSEFLWRWSEVQETVAAFGSSLPMITSPEDITGLNAEFAWNNEDQALFVSMRKLVQQTDADIRMGLVHEATHRVFGRLVRNSTQYTPREMSILSMMCEDVDLRETFVDESIAFLNEAAWFFSAAEPRPPGHEGFILGLQRGWRGLHGDVSEARAFRRVMLGYARDESAAYARLNPDLPPRITCGSPAIIRGPLRGTFFRPTTLVSDRLGIFLRR